MKRSAILGAAAILASALGSPAMAQEVIYNPGYCAQFYPNANCQNRGPGNPYTGSYQRQVSQNQAYRDSTYRDSTWRNSYNRWDDNSGFWPGECGRRVGGRSARGASPPPRSAPKPMPAATALSASPAPGSAARMAGSISASEALRSSARRRPQRPPFSMRRIRSRRPRRGSGPLRTSLVFEPPEIGPMRRLGSPHTDRFNSPV